jgi:fluoride exporter
VLPHLDRRVLGAVFAGGALGTLLRAALSEAFPHDASAWPWPTLVVNVAGAFVLGWVVTRLPEHPHTQRWRAFVGPGLCGGVTTFSTMQLELVRMVEADRFGLALGYAAASVALGLLAVRVATAVARERVRSR